MDTHQVEAFGLFKKKSKNFGATTKSKVTPMPMTKKSSTKTRDHLSESAGSKRASMIEISKMDVEDAFNDFTKDHDQSNTSMIDNERFSNRLVSQVESV